MNITDLLTALPIEIVAVTALVVMLVDAFVPHTTAACRIIAIIGLIGGIVAAAWTIPLKAVGFNDMVAAGGMVSLFDMLFCASGILTILLSREYFERMGGAFDEFYTLLMFSIAGMMLIAHAADLIILFVGIEVMSICFYVMSGLARKEVSSNEAALKYFLLGAFISGFLVYGIALLYGSVGSTHYSAIPNGAVHTAWPALFWAGFGLTMVGLSFKVAAFPFHQWAPDVYQGAPTVVTGFMSTGGKAAAFSGFIGLMVPVVMSGAAGVGYTRMLIAVFAVGSMFIGNITAIAQTNVKRMLAYSSVAHAGYMLIGIAAANSVGFDAIVYYLIAYLFMQLGAFAVVGILEREHGTHLTLDDYRGLGRRHPAIAMVMAIFMLSLTGMPPFAGFFGKYYLFYSAVKSDMTWLAILGVISSVISAWFYLGLIVTMFFREPERSEEPTAAPGAMSSTALALAIAGTLVIGFLPELILRYSDRVLAAVTP